MSRHLVAAVCALLLCITCDHATPLQPPPSQSPRGNQPPVARIEGPSTAREGQTVAFTTRGSVDPEGGHLTFLWDFGNGTTVTSGDLYPPNTVWAGYDDDGLYHVTLVVQDDSGAVDTARTTIAVANTPPKVALLEPPEQQAVGVTALAQIGISDSGSADTHTSTIRWGDGTSDSRATRGTIWSPDTIRHAYTKPGEYWVSVTVRDDDGGVDSAVAGYPVIVFDATERQLI